jgi:hypothetical protein
MNMSLDKWVLVSLIAVSVLAGFMLGRMIFPREIPVQQTTVVRDTLIVPDTVKVNKLKAQINYLNDSLMYMANNPRVEIKTVNDTIYRVIDPPEWVRMRYATADTVIDSVGTFSIDYFFPPENYFNFQFNPVPRHERTITLTKYVETPRAWYESPYLWGAVGAGAGYLIGRE